MKLGTTALTIALAALTACADSTAPITASSLAGSYLASSQVPTGSGATIGALTFTTTQDGVVTDWLAKGAEIEIDLSANGTTSGRLFIPNLNDDGEEQAGVNFDESLAGTWKLEGDQLTLSHEADTFIRDMTFTVTDGVISGTHTFGGVAIHVTLARVGQ